MGQLVGAGGATTLATIVQLEPIYVNFSVSETDVQSIRAGIRARGLTPQDLKRSRSKSACRARRDILTADF